MFAIRGVIEGFYGTPWTHEQRLDLLGFLADRGMNTFVYAPKDDPLVREDWRTPYAGADLSRLSALLDRGREVGVDVVWCLSPGLSIRYASEDDTRAVLAKLDSVAGLGVRTFGLLLDDIPDELQHPEDQSAFGDLIDAQIPLIQRVFERLTPAAGLMVCPTLYYGDGDEPSIIRLGQAIDPRIDLFWTGRRIVSPTIDLAGAETFRRSTRRPPIWWDNYPVNDLAMAFERHIGPYLGRDPRLDESSRGVIANAMEHVEASKIPLATIADYLVDPFAYDPEASWQAAIEDIAGHADAPAFALFADNVRSSALSRAEAPILTAALDAFAADVARGDVAAAGRSLRPVADGMVAAADHLLRGPVTNRALIDECRPWIEVFGTGARAVRCLAELAEEEQRGDEAAQILRALLDQLAAPGLHVFGDVVSRTITAYLEP